MYKIVWHSNFSLFYAIIILCSGFFHSNTGFSFSSLLSLLWPPLMNPLLTSLNLNHTLFYLFSIQKHWLFSPFARAENINQESFENSYFYNLDGDTAHFLLIWSNRQTLIYYHIKSESLPTKLPSNINFSHHTELLLTKKIVVFTHLFWQTFWKYVWPLS